MAIKNSFMTGRVFWLGSQKEKNKSLIGIKTLIFWGLLGIILNIYVWRIIEPANIPSFGIRPAFPIGKLALEIYPACPQFVAEFARGSSGLS